MSLDYNWSKCENQKEILEKDQKHITDGIIWRLMFLEVQQITEKNLDDLYQRSRLYDKIFGTELQKLENKEITDYYLTKEDYRKRIGLYTNVITKKQSVWMKKIILNAMEKVKREIKCEDYIKTLKSKELNYAKRTR